MPFARIDWANSAKRSGWKTERGCKGFGSMRSMLIRNIPTLGCSGGRAGAAAAATGADSTLGAVLVGRSAESPLPNALRGSSELLLIFQYLLCQFHVTFRPFGSHVVLKNRFPI